MCPPRALGRTFPLHSQPLGPGLGLPPHPQCSPAPALSSVSCSPSFSTFLSFILSSLCHLGQGFEILILVTYTQTFTSKHSSQVQGGAVWGHTFVGDTVGPTRAGSKWEKLPSKQTSLKNLLPALRGQPCSTLLQKHPL